MIRLRLLALTLFAAVAMPSGAVASSGPHLHWFKQGQCTRYAYQKRPDIVDEGYRQHGFLHWDGWEWAGHARASGFPVGRHPRKGDIAVWQPGVGGASSKGHLAYVESVTAKGKVRVTQVNWNGNHKSSKRTLTRSYASKLEFVHRLGG
jgi:surface antigen